MSRRLSPATVVAGVALFFAIGGGALAASRVLITSIHQISPGVVSKLRGKQGPPGRQGAPGQQGAPGPQGAPGVVPAYALVDPNGGSPRLVSDHTSGFVAVSVGPAGQGDYCLTPAPGVNVTSTAAVATEEAFYSGGAGIVTVRYRPAGRPAARASLRSRRSTRARHSSTTSRSRSTSPDEPSGRHWAAALGADREQPGRAAARRRVHPECPGAGPGGDAVQPRTDESGHEANALVRVLLVELEHFAAVHLSRKAARRCRNDHQAALSCGLIPGAADAPFPRNQHSARGLPRPLLWAYWSSFRDRRMSGERLFGLISANRPPRRPRGSGRFTPRACKPRAWPIRSTVWMDAREKNSYTDRCARREQSELGGDAEKGLSGRGRRHRQGVAALTVAISKAGVRTVGPLTVASRSWSRPERRSANGLTLDRADPRIAGRHRNDRLRRRRGRLRVRAGRSGSDRHQRTRRREPPRGRLEMLYP